MYNITGMTCTGCQAKVQLLLAGVPHVNKVSIDLSQGLATISMDQHIPEASLQAALAEYPRYQLTEKTHHQSLQKPDAAIQSGKDSHSRHGDPVTQTAINSSELLPDTAVDDTTASSWFIVYKPILLIFGFLIGITLLHQLSGGSFHLMDWMYDFMAGFFLVFAFFKLLNLSGFADSYAMYDVVAHRWKSWGFIYPFVELFLGIALLIRWQPVFTNIITLVVMSISLIGVLQSVLNKKKIRCACLGDVFNLPMSTVTIVEDGLMIVMSTIMLIAWL